MAFMLLGWVLKGVWGLVAYAVGTVVLVAGIVKVNKENKDGKN